MMFSITDADWLRISRGETLPDTLRVALNNLGENYQHFARLAEQRRRAADVRADLQAVAKQAARLLVDLTRLDAMARMALADMAGPSAGPTPRRDAVVRLEHHAEEISRLEGWLRGAANQISAEQPGPAANAEALRWLVEGFAHAYADCMGRPMTSEVRISRLLGDFARLVDPSVRDRSLAAARKGVLASLHN